jgi:hypothetical protein
MVHLSLNEGMDRNWPFGASILESIFKTFKQKELLEDSILIYRVQRAPERRIFYIDVGDMQPLRAKAHIEAIKNEIHQRRIPNRTGGGASVVDAAYNPLSMLDDYFFAQTAEGRGSKVETFPVATLSAKSATLPTSPRRWLAVSRFRPATSSLVMTSSLLLTMTASWLRRWFRSSSSTSIACVFRTCLAPVFDKKFKDYLDRSGVSIDEGLFELQFHPPQNFTKYRQIELDLQQTQVYGQVQGIKASPSASSSCASLVSREDELLENEKLYMEENAAKLKKKTGAHPPRVSRKATLVRSACVLPGRRRLRLQRIRRRCRKKVAKDKAVKVAAWAAKAVVETWAAAAWAGGAAPPPSWWSSGLNINSRKEGLLSEDYGSRRSE